MSERLTDEQLESIRIAALGDEDRQTYPSLSKLLSMCEELQELRALLATPLPCGWATPEVVTFVDRDGAPAAAVGWSPLDTGPNPLDPDEVAGLGAALLRAAREARGGR